jgi:hypothetical protein
MGRLRQSAWQLFWVFWQSCELAPGADSARE